MNELTAVFFLCTTILIIYLFSKDKENPYDFDPPKTDDSKVLTVVSLIAVQQLVIVVLSAATLIAWVFP